MTRWLLGGRLGLLLLAIGQPAQPRVHVAHQEVQRDRQQEKRQEPAQSGGDVAAFGIQVASFRPSYAMCISPDVARASACSAMPSPANRSDSSGRTGT